ncbi:MAG: DUF3810 domain-containing protein [Lachnospiraceae bacterium]|nr:DUF3810 domain-containing protein [Lachnospiraceae bacterium]
MRKRLCAAAVIAAASLLLRAAARRVEGFADSYAAYMTAFRANTQGRISGIFPFSLAEMMIYLALAGVFIFLICGIRKMKKGEKVKSFLLGGCTWLVLIASLILFFYEAGEDVYFYATPFSVRNGFGNGAYTTEELEAVCESLASACVERADTVSRNAEGVMIADAELEDRVRIRMAELGEGYRELSGYYPKPKGAALSVFLSYMDFSGIYASYTDEANYNRDMTDYNKPFTMCHELSHVKGILQENEANFTAFLACIDAEDADIAYSGALMGWIYCGNELYKRDYDRWLRLASTLPDSVNADLNANSAFWKQYEGITGDTVQNLNDSYLKSHGQEGGVETYDRVVDLIVSWYLQK